MLRLMVMAVGCKIDAGVVVRCNFVLMVVRCKFVPMVVRCRFVLMVVVDILHRAIGTLPVGCCGSS